jgi:hypothetical protein
MDFEELEGEAMLDELPDTDASEPEDVLPDAAVSMPRDAGKRDAGAGAGADAGKAARDASLASAGRDASPAISNARDAGAETDTGAAAPIVDAGNPVTSSCRAGTYAGTFEGELSLVAGIDHPVRGTVSLPTVLAADRDALQFESGTFTGSDDDGNVVTATVRGSFRCSTGALESAAIGELDYARRLINPSTRYALNLGGSYASASSSASGSWTADSQNSTGRGKGTWSVTLP